MKPRLYMRNGWWHCFSLHFGGIRRAAGVTPREAYLNWRACYG